jgi:phosphoribosylformylglycinamidine cyclo-ligase
VATESDLYRAAGVDIEGGNRAVELMRAAVRSTHGPSVLSGHGAFGGAYDLDGDTVLVASADGVGTKLQLGALLGRHAALGADLVNHCVNDILSAGARPLFFLDYFATGSLVPDVVAEVVRGMAGACAEAGCALLGGETAEMPGLYPPGEYDLAGFIVGRVSRDRMLEPGNVGAGDALVALPSTGPHTNGYSLVRHILTGGGARPLDAERLQAHEPELGAPLGDALLAPHRSYLHEVGPLCDAGLVHGIAHITGGGLPGNVPRMLGPGTAARVFTGSWTPPPVFGWIRREGGVSEAEMYRVFNMGVGLVLAVAPENVADTLRADPGAWVLGEILEGDGDVRLVASDDA